MFAIIKDNKFVKFLPSDTPFEINGLRYPANYLNLSSAEEKAKLGIVDVVYTARPDDKYYWVSEVAPVVKDGAVIVEYTATPKDLTGLLDQATEAVNVAAGGLLAPSDYMILKAFENGSAVSPDWLAWRKEIRAQAKAQKSLIAAIDTVDGIATLAPVQWANDPNFIKPSI